jgi:hypothetical protein
MAGVCAWLESPHRRAQSTENSIFLIVAMAKVNGKVAKSIFPALEKP